jgi:hypothetical protein
LTNLEIALGWLGVQASEKSGRLSLLCPFHDDNNPSASVYFDTERFYCFTCNLSLDFSQFAAKVQGVSVAAAAREMKERFGIEVAEKDSEDEILLAATTKKWVDKMLKEARRQLSYKDHAAFGENFDLLAMRFRSGELNAYLYEERVTGLVLELTRACGGVDDLGDVN